MMKKVISGCVRRRRVSGPYNLFIRGCMLCLWRLYGILSVFIGATKYISRTVAKLFSWFSSKNKPSVVREASYVMSVVKSSDNVEESQPPINEVKKEQRNNSVRRITFKRLDIPAEKVKEQEHHAAEIGKHVVEQLIGMANDIGINLDELRKMSVINETYRDDVLEIEKKVNSALNAFRQISEGASKNNNKERSACKELLSLYMRYWELAYMPDINMVELSEDIVDVMKLADIRVEDFFTKNKSSWTEKAQALVYNKVAKNILNRYNSVFVDSNAMMLNKTDIPKALLLACQKEIKDLLHKGGAIVGGINCPRKSKGWFGLSSMSVVKQLEAKWNKLSFRGKVFLLKNILAPICRKVMVRVAEEHKWTNKYKMSIEQIQNYITNFVDVVLKNIVRAYLSEQMIIKNNRIKLLRF